MEATQESKNRRGTLYAAIVASTVLLITSALKWTFVDLATPILWIQIDLWITLGFLGVLIWAIIHAVRGWRQWRRTSIPLALCLVATAAAVFAPFTDLWLKNNFALYRATREAVIDQVLDGTLQPNVEHNASLIALHGVPLGTSAGGNEIVVERHEGSTYVFFFTLRGILDNYSGYLFVSGDADPRLFMDMSEPGAEIVEIEEHWYFTSHR